MKTSTRSIEVLYSGAEKLVCSVCPAQLPTKLTSGRGFIPKLDTTQLAYRNVTCGLSKIHAQIIDICASPSEYQARYASFAAMAMNRATRHPFSSQLNSIRYRRDPTILFTMWYL